MQSNKVAIIGGGFSGMTAAYYLAQDGYEVTIYERNPTLGGLVSQVTIGGTPIEKFYHHAFSTDTHLIELAHELGLSKNFVWIDSSIGTYYGGNLYPFMSPKDLLTFKPLSLVDRIRLGLFTLFVKKFVDYEKYWNVPAEKWFSHMAGKRAYDIVWKPLLKGKFHDKYKEVSAAWLCSRLNARSESKKSVGGVEQLGYFLGGYEVLISALQKRLEQLGVKIELGITVDEITYLSEEDKVAIRCGGQVDTYKYAICTAPSPVFLKMIQNNSSVTQAYKDDLMSISYLGAVCVLFSTDQSLTKYYWNNINDAYMPFVVLIQHTNLVDKKHYDNKNVFYLGCYYNNDHAYFSMPEEEVIRVYFDALKEVFPDFSSEKVQEVHLSRAKNAQHVVDINYKKELLNPQTPMKNVYLFNFSQLVGRNRNVSSAIWQGKQARKVLYEAENTNT